ncbi:hypothetical protein WA158_006134 [Blastocystis sp. Blastoise]
MIQSARLNVSNKGLVGVNHRATGHEYRNYIVPGSIPDGEERHPINYSIAPNSLAAVKRIESNMVNNATLKPLYSFLKLNRPDIIKNSYEEYEETEPIDEGSGLLPDGRIPKNFTRKLIYAHDYVLPYMKRNNIDGYETYSKLLNFNTIEDAIDFNRKDHEGYLYSKGGNLFSNVFNAVGDVYHVADRLTGGVQNITNGVNKIVDKGAETFNNMKEWFKKSLEDDTYAIREMANQARKNRDDAYDVQWWEDPDAKNSKNILADRYYPFAHTTNTDNVRIHNKVKLNPEIKKYQNKLTQNYQNDLQNIENDEVTFPLFNTMTNLAYSKDFFENGNNHYKVNRVDIPLLPKPDIKPSKTPKKWTKELKEASKKKIY